jgi:hypothetical protein
LKRYGPLSKKEYGPKGKKHLFLSTLCYILFSEKRTKTILFTFLREVHRIRPALNSHHLQPPLHRRQAQAVDLLCSPQMTKFFSMLDVVQTGEVEGRAKDVDIEEVIKGLESLQLTDIIADHPVVVNGGAGLRGSIHEGQGHPHPEQPEGKQRFQKKALFLSNPVFLEKLGRGSP